MPRTLLIALIFAAVSSPSAQALEVERSIELAASPKTVWQALGNFCGIDDWDPAVTTCVLTEGKKPQRTLTFSDGKVIVEERQVRDDDAMRYTYTMIEGPLPVSNYTATLAVAPNGSGAKVTWTGSFTAKGVPDAEAEKTIGALYEQGLNGLAAEAP